MSRVTLPYLRAVNHADYGHGDTGFIVECLGYWNTDLLHYGHPAWDERCFDELSGPFPTLEAAQAAIDESGLQHDKSARNDF